MRNRIKLIRCGYHLIIMKICYRISLVLVKLHTSLEHIVIKNASIIEDSIEEDN